MIPHQPSSEDLTFMRSALDCADEARAVGEVPIGAVIVKEGRVIARAFNMREAWQDPTAHAEIIVIQAAAKALKSWRLLGTTLYVTLEPCAMCVGAILLARIPRVVFAAWDPKGGACGSVFDLTQEPRVNHQVTVLGGVLQDESQRVLQKFFQRLRTGEGDAE
jgi:tRNA(adenine34) deaminase